MRLAQLTLNELDLADNFESLRECHVQWRE